MDAGDLMEYAAGGWQLLLTKLCKECPEMLRAAKAKDSQFGNKLRTKTTGAR
jgi:hypothetical protein